jgi:hypothetical protein
MSVFVDLSSQTSNPSQNPTLLSHEEASGSFWLLWAQLVSDQAVAAGCHLGVNFERFAVTQTMECFSF